MLSVRSRRDRKRFRRNRQIVLACVFFFFFLGEGRVGNRVKCTATNRLAPRARVRVRVAYI